MTIERRTGLDFDGTVTDVECEARNYAAGYREDMRAHLGFSEEEFERIWNQVTRMIESATGEFGWRDTETNRIVAPATADPMLLTRETAAQILIKLKDDPELLEVSPAQILEDKLPQDGVARHQLLEGFFDSNYGRLETHFRPGAADFLKQLLELGRLVVITNSGTKNVLKKIAKLRERHPSLPEIDVRGDARKFELVPDFVIEGMATELDCSPHLLRPVFTQRGKYYEVLEECGMLEPGSNVVAGDVWELDLMLPLLLDMRCAFITRPMTPDHEIDIVGEEVRRGRARFGHNLEGLLEEIKDLHRA